MCAIIFESYTAHMKHIPCAWASVTAHLSRFHWRTYINTRTGPRLYIENTKILFIERPGCTFQARITSHRFCSSGTPKQTNRLRDKRIHLQVAMRVTTRQESRIYMIRSRTIVCSSHHTRNIKTSSCTRWQWGRTIEGAEVDGAYLCGKFDISIRMEQTAYPCQVLYRPGMDWILLMYLYGMGQVSRIWGNVIHSHLIKLGFFVSKFDPRLHLITWHNCFIILLIVVDNIVFSSNHEKLLNEMNSTISAIYSI